MQKMFITVKAEVHNEPPAKPEGIVYSWKTRGNENWLERGILRTDVVGYVVIPDTVYMPDDEDEEENG